LVFLACAAGAAAVSASATDAARAAVLAILVIAFVNVRVPANLLSRAAWNTARSDGCHPRLQGRRAGSADAYASSSSSGEVDVLTAPQLGAAVDDEEAFDDLVIDLANVPFMSSVGLGLISSLNRRQTRRGRGFALAAVKGDVEHLLEITGLTDALVIGETASAAIDLMRGSGGYYDT